MEARRKRGRIGYEAAARVWIEALVIIVAAFMQCGPVHASVDTSFRLTARILRMAF